MAIVPAGTIPLFDKPDKKDMIMIDAGKPDKIVKGFIMGSDDVYENIPAAEMSLKLLHPKTVLKKEVFPGSPIAHYRLQASTKAVSAKFLTFYYPYKTGIEQPEFKKIDTNTNFLKWQNCTDLICINSKKEINIKGIKSDADLVLIRKHGDFVISFVMMNGSFLSFNNKELIKLSGGKGIAGWSDDTLTVSGQNTSNCRVGII